MPVDPRVAERLLPHCPAGPVLDMLVMSRGRVFSGLLSAPPSDEVAWKVVTSFGADSAEALIPVLTSPSLLERIALKEKRKGTLRALCANPHLPPEAREVLRKKALHLEDVMMARELIRPLSPREKVAYLEAHADLTRLLDHTSARQVASVLVESRDEDLVREHLGDPVLTGHLLVKGLQRSGLSLALLVEALEVLEKDTRPQDSYVASSLGQRIADEAPDLVMRALSLGWEDLTTSLLLRLVVREDERAEDFFALLSPAERAPVLEKVFSASSMLPLWLAQVMVADGVRWSGRYGVERRVSQETAEYLAFSLPWEFGQQFVSRLTNEKRRELVLSLPLEEIDVAALRLTAADLTLLAEHLTKEQYLAALRPLLRHYGGVSTELLRPVLMEVSPEVFARGTFSLEEAREILTRTDLPLAVQEAVQRTFLNHEDSTLEEVREALTGSSSFSNAVHSLLRGENTRKLRAGEFTSLLSLPEMAASAAKVLEGYSLRDGEWVQEAVLALPLQWKHVAPPAARVAAEVMQERFQDDFVRWETALGLLSEWTGTLEEMLEAVEMLHG